MSMPEKRLGYSDSVDIKNSDVVYPFRGSDMHIEIFSTGKLVYEGRYSVLEYQTEFISFRIAKRNLNISGERLRLKNVSVQTFTVIGNILSIEFA